MPIELRSAEFFNFAEALLWLAFAGALLLCRQKYLPLHGKNRILLVSALFVTFGISDFVEMSTGAWWKPWWLFLWKAINTAALAYMTVALLRTKRRLHNCTPDN